MRKIAHALFASALLLAVMMITLVPLTGCGGGDEEAAADDTADIRAAAEGFLDAMEAGDMDKMKEYSDPALFAEDGDLYAFNGIDTMGKEMAEAVGMGRRTLEHLNEKYAEGGYLHLLIPGSPNEAPLAELRSIIKDGARLRGIFESVFVSEGK